MCVFRKKQEYILQYFYIPDVSNETNVVQPDCWRLRFPLWIIKIICPGYAAPSLFSNERYSFSDEYGQDYFVFILDMPLKKRISCFLSNNFLYNRNCIKEQRIKYDDENSSATLSSPGTYKIGSDYIELNSNSFDYIFPNQSNLKTIIFVYRTEQDFKQLVLKLQSTEEMEFELNFGRYEFEIKIEYKNKLKELCILEQKVRICVIPAK